MQRSADLKARFEALYSTYGPAHIARDPISLPHRFSRRQDQEVAAFIAAALAYGNRPQICKSASTILSYLGDRPAEAVRRLSPGPSSRDLAGFTHRFNTGRDVALLLHILGRLLESFGSLNAAFLSGYDASHDNTGPALAVFCERALATGIGNLSIDGKIGAAEGVRFFFSSPADGSACKRLNMFLRWMVRHDEIDLGTWNGVLPSKLVIPVDTHIARVSRRLGLTRLKSPGWPMALEITSSLRKLDPDDPVRYDFALYNWSADMASGKGGVH
jgi:uncharacterized protein (TIGR02757 family)